MTILTTGSFCDTHDARPLAVSVKTACKLVGVGRTTMFALIKTGRVKTISIGRRRLVVYSSMEALVSEAGPA
jgi:excisionase family DNA binding protein